MRFIHLRNKRLVLVRLTSLHDVFCVLGEVLKHLERPTLHKLASTKANHTKLNFLNDSGNFN